MLNIKSTHLGASLLTNLVGMIMTVTPQTTLNMSGMGSKSGMKASFYGSLCSLLKYFREKKLPISPFQHTIYIEAHIGIQ